MGPRRWLFLAAALVVALVTAAIYVSRPSPVAHRMPPAPASPSPGLQARISALAVPGAYDYVGGIVVGSDGTMFITGHRPDGTEVVIKVTPPNSFSNIWTVNRGQLVDGMALSPDGSLWIIETQQDGAESKLVRIGPSGKVTQYLVPTNPEVPAGMTFGPDGNLWLPDYEGSSVLRITPDGVVTRFPIPAAGGGPGGIVSGSDGNLWFTGQRRVAKMTTSGAITEFFVPRDVGLAGIALAPDGNLWMTAVPDTRLPDAGPGEILKMTPSGRFAGYPIPSAKTFPGEQLMGDPIPGQIVLGPDGNLWFTALNNIDRISPSGDVTQFVIPPLPGDTISRVNSIAAAPGGGIRFVGTSSNLWHIQGMVGEIA